MTLALVSRGAFPGGRLLPYWAQLAGAFVGASWSTPIMAMHSGPSNEMSTWFAG